MDLRGFGLSDDDLRQLGYKVGDAREGSGSTSEPFRPAAAAKKRDPAWRVWAATLAILALAGWAGSSHRGLPRPVSASAPDTLFSSARALAQLVEISERPHTTGSPEQERVLGYLVARLRSLGLEPGVQTTTDHVRDSSLVRAATVRNVVARIPGTASTGAILLTAHYDAAPLSPGGADDGVGVATVLETARAVLAGPAMRNDLIVLFTDADELGLFGSRAFASSHPWMPDVRLVLSVQARGGTGPSVPFEVGAENGRIVDALATVRADPAMSSLARSLWGTAVESAPDDPLRRGGIPEVTLVALGGQSLEHQTRDTRDRVSERTLQQGGDQLLALTRSVGGQDVSQGRLAAPDQAYVALPWIGMVHYRTVWGVAGTLAMVVLWSLLGLVLKARRGTLRGVLLGAAWSLVVVGSAAAAARVLFTSLRGVHPEYGALRTAFYREGILIAAVAAAALVCATLSYAALRRFARQDEMVWGGLAVPSLGVLLLTFTAPFAVVAAQWPIGLAALAGALVIVLGPKRAATTWAWAPLVLLSGAAVALAVPSVELLSETLTLRAATGLGVAIGSAALVAAPLMDRLLRPRLWWTPLVGAGAAAALVAVSLIGGRADRPTPTTLLYLTDRPVNPEPLPVRSSDTPADTSRIRAMAGNWLTVPGPGEEWARSWAGAPATDTDPGVLLVGDDDAYQVIGTGPDADLAAPTVEILGSALEGARRRVQLGLEAGLEAEMTGIYLPDGADAELRRRGLELVADRRRSRPARRALGSARGRAAAIRRRSRRDDRPAHAGRRRAQPATDRSARQLLLPAAGLDGRQHGRGKRPDHSADPAAGAPAGCPSRGEDRGRAGAVTAAGHAEALPDGASERASGPWASRSAATPPSRAPRP